MKNILLLFLMAVALVACTDTSTKETKTQTTQVYETRVLSVEEQKEVVKTYDEGSRELLEQLRNAADQMQVYMSENEAGTLNTATLEEKQQEFIDTLDNLSYEAGNILDINGLPEDVGKTLENASLALAEYFHSEMEAAKIAFKMGTGDQEKYKNDSELALMQAATKILEVKEMVGLPSE